MSTNVYLNNLRDCSEKITQGVEVFEGGTLITAFIGGGNPDFAKY